MTEGFDRGAAHLVKASLPAAEDSPVKEEVNSFNENETNILITF